jgi:hypothetical protein
MMTMMMMMKVAVAVVGPRQDEEESRQMACVVRLKTFNSSFLG